VELTGQLSNQAIKEGITALWSLTRENLPTTSLELSSPESQPALRTPRRALRRLAPGKVEELIQGYIDGVPVDIAGEQVPG
jgi:hypothetical protein